jgi:outer membrane protein assembly factor BamB
MIADDGTLRTTGWLTGKDVQRPTPFLPANARHSDPLVVDNVLYTSTSNGCGGAPNAIWAVDVSDPETKKVMSTRLDGGNPVGAVAMTTNGTVIAAVSPGRVIALDQKTLQIKNWFSARDFDPAAGPIVLQHAGKDVVAVPAKDGRVFLLDPATLGGATQDPPMYVSRSFGTISGALATWQDGTGTQWLLVPSSTSVIALKVADAGGKPSLADGWTSRALVAPVTPIIVNDVVFAASSGQPRGRAVLYALDGKTGKELWNSGTEMTSFMPGRTMWGANSQVHVGTADGMVYQFGFLLERR